MQSPPEVFDTAMALLALIEVRKEPGVDELIWRGGAFLVAQQQPDGSWTETTRPSGGESYAQRLSTTG
jgi:squalene cyclase